MNIANSITILRIGISPVVLFLFFKEINYLGLFAYSLAIFTDLIDGKIARKKNQITNFGIIMDPIADKILIIAILIVLIKFNWVPAWMCILIGLREILVTSIRTFYLAKGKVIPAKTLGKYKTIWQMLGLLIILLLFIFQIPAKYLISNLIMVLILFISVISAIDFFLKLKFSK